MRGQPVGKTGLADKASLSIRPVETVLQLTLFVEHNNIASLQLPGQAAGDPNVVGQDVTAGLQGFADDIHEELRLFAVDNPVRDGEAHQQRQAERTERGEAPAAARVFHRQPAHQRPDGKSDRRQQTFIQLNLGPHRLMHETPWRDHQHGDKPQQTNAQVDHPVDAQRFRAGLCGLQRVAGHQDRQRRKARQNIGRQFAFGDTEEQERHRHPT